MKGVNINCKEVDFVEKIFDKSNPKTIETRNSGSLDSLLGKRVAVIKTGCGPAMCYGFITFRRFKQIITNKEYFDSLYHKHFVPADSKTYAFKTEKHLYEIIDATPCKPFAITEKGIVIRNLNINEEDY